MVNQKKVRRKRTWLEMKKLVRNFQIIVSELSAFYASCKVKFIVNIFKNYCIIVEFQFKFKRLQKYFLKKSTNKFYSPEKKINQQHIQKVKTPAIRLISTFPLQKCAHKKLYTYRET